LETLRSSVIIRKTRSGNQNAPINMHSEYWQRKVERPSFQVLKNEVEKLGYSVTGKKYGVSDNAVRKWLKFYENQSEMLN